MNKIVREHYPVERLPDDLRRELGAAGRVRVTIEEEEPPAASGAIIELLAEAARLRESGVIRTVSSEEAVARVRVLRDEWDR